VNCAVVIPCFNEAERVGGVVRGALAFLPRVIVVDDGSSDATCNEASNAGVEVIRHEKNLGKGSAVQTGLNEARKRGFEWALLMDGDGQHAAADIPKFLSTTDARLVIGNRMGDSQCMPWLRRFVNRWMSARLSRRLGLALPDTQCGFRLVHLPSWSTLKLKTSHFEIESEMISAFVEAGFSVTFVPVQAIYRNETSKIDPILDTIRWFRWWSHAS
jgi:glycosyltransferase involved in cell wall biosynthesis